MAEATPVIATLAVVMLAAAAITLLFHRVRQPAILGYLAAGFLIGPHTPLGFPLADLDTVQALRDLGLVFLMFALGLEFNLRKVKRVGGVALVAGTLEIALMLGLGFLLGGALGWTPLQSLFLGSVLAISSTTIIVAILRGQGRMDAEDAHLIFGILIVEDLVAVVLIAILGGLAGAGAVTLASVALLVAAIGGFVLAALILGLVVVPRLIDAVSRLGYEEVLVVTVLGLALGMSLLASELGFSIALGAFIAGAVISEARASSHVERRIAPIRDMFTAVFFVAVGMLLLPAVIAANAWLILLILAVAVVGKILAVTFASFVAGYPPRTAIRAGIGLAMIGEFSFILATLAEDVLPELFPIAVAVSAGTAFVTPALMRRAPSILSGLARILPAPLVTYARLYREWVARLVVGGRIRQAVLPPGAVFRLVAYVAVVAGLVVAANFLGSFVAAWIRADAATAPWVALAVWVAAGLLAAPALVAAMRNLSAIIHALAELAIPTRLRDREAAEAVARVLRATFWLFATVAAGVAFLVLAGPFLPSLPLLLVAAGLVTIASIALYGATARLNARLDEAVASVVEKGPVETSRDDVLRTIRDQYPWDVAVDHATVPADGAGAGRTLADLEVRQATGASIVVVERAGERLVNPGPTTTLLPGDVLTLLGEREQVEAAKVLLRTALRSPAGARIAMEPVAVLPESRLLGRTVGESGIRERTGATVVGLRRADGRTLTNPPPATTIEPGDVLLVLGSAEQLERARGLLGGIR